MTNAVLVSSIGAKHSLLRVLKKAMSDFNPTLVLIGADADANPATKKSVDIFWQMPRLEELTLELLLAYVRENSVKYIIPTRDTELLFFASHKEVLRKAGVFVFVADFEAVTFCYDKLKFYSEDEENWAIETSEEITKLHTEKFVVKERFGAGSKSIKLECSEKEALTHAKSLNSAIFQPYIQGQEYSIECYVSKSMQCEAVVVRSRDVVVNGESAVTTTHQMPELEQKAAIFVEKHKLQGHSLLQVLVNEKGSYLIECNARFGGASSLSEYVGLRSFYWFFLESVDREFSAVLNENSIQQKRVDGADSYHVC